MRSTRLIITLAVALAACAVAQTTAAHGSVAPSSAGGSGIDLSAIDKTADPCADFYQYACGTWLANNAIPPDQPAWGRFSELQQRNETILRGILEKAEVDAPNRTPVEQKIGDYYYACMDEKAIDARGDQPIKPDLARIDALSDKHAIEAELVKDHREGVNAFFAFSSTPDPKNSTMEIGDADQGGLGLPDRDYYLKADQASVTLRKQYVEHVAAMFALTGDAPEAAAAHAAAILTFETKLAKGALGRVERRDPLNLYHKMTVHELTSLCPFFDWPAYFNGVGAPKFDTLNVDVPNFFRALETAMVDTSLDDLKTYLKWHVIHANAALLSPPFVDANFAFYGKALTGAKELRPRWKRCVSLSDSQLGFALGQKYVQETFGPGGKERTLKMIREIEKAMNADLQSLTWMTPETKKQALIKLAAVTNKIGYPDKWRDYSTVTIVRGDFVGNSKRAAEFEVHRELRKIGQPVDRREWEMTPPTVNAYYEPLENSINFPAGILQPPFYSNAANDAVNYGGIGAVMGHELTHGFDDEGRKYDGQGNLREWWTKADAEAFEKRAQCFIDEYSSFKAVDDVHVNGKLTLGENTADNGGIRLAFMALMDLLNGRQLAPIDGYTTEQQYFIAYGQIWCEKQTGEFARLLTQVDPHSPPQDRVNGVLRNFPEFRKAFSCKVGQPMVAAPACRVW